MRRVNLVLLWLNVAGLWGLVAGRTPQAGDLDKASLILLLLFVMFVIHDLHRIASAARDIAAQLAQLRQAPDHHPL